MCGLKTFFKLVIAVTASTASCVAAAQNYPDKPVKIIMPYAPGGTGDIMARLVAKELTRQTGKSFVVENRTGAGGLIGYGVTAHAPADGYTLVAMDSSFAMFPALYRGKVDWDLEHDLTPISMYSQAPFALVVNSSKPYKNVADLIDAARAHPNAINYGTPGLGTLHHVFTALFASTTQTKMTHVPYRGASDALAAVLGNNVDFTYVAVPTIIGQLGNHRLDVLAVTSGSRLAVTPNIPTLQESGVPLTINNWFGLAAPKGTPQPIVDYLADAVAKAVKSPDVEEKLKSMGADAVGNSPKEFAATFQKDMNLWRKVIEENGIKLED